MCTSRRPNLFAIRSSLALIVTPPCCTTAGPVSTLVSALVARMERSVMREQSHGLRRSAPRCRLRSIVWERLNMKAVASQNISFISHSDQGGRGDGVQVMVHRGYAYV